MIYRHRDRTINTILMQSKKQSLIEVLASTIIGLLVSLLTQIVVFPFYGMQIRLIDNIQITIIFTVVSIIRSYFVRRLFNRKQT